MYCLHPFLTLSPNPWVCEMAGVFTPDLLEDLSMSRRREGWGVLVAEDAEGQDVFGLSHRGCTLLCTGSRQEHLPLVVWLTFARCRGAGDLNVNSVPTIVFQKKGRGLGVRSLARHVSRPCGSQARPASVQEGSEMGEEASWGSPGRKTGKYKQEREEHVALW